MLARMQRKGNPLALLVGMQAGAATVENSMEVPQKVKNNLLYNPGIAPLGIYPKEYKVTNVKGCMHPYVYCSIIYKSQDMEAAQVFADR